ncbi:MAG: ABC transporter ATP-binding protein [Syntrophomonas sp.]|nr:ABC transporter ATP-binding protein [Syntrophomonas sp.]
MKLEIRNVVCGYGFKTVVNDFSATVSSGEILCLLGPNGVGKTTLFKSVLGFLKLQGGAVLVDGLDVRNLSKKAFAQVLGYVPQAHVPPFPFTVRDVVVMGRSSYLGAFGTPGKHDIEVAESCLESLGVSFLANRVYTELSGGERQMVLIARALTQEPAFIMMDEPTSNLDFGNQVRVLRHISKLAQDGLGIIMTTHFPDHAFQCHCKVALMQRNDVFIFGSAEEVVTEKNLYDAYGIEVKVKDTHFEYFTIRSCMPIIEETDSSP